MPDWSVVEIALKTAKAIAFDECHKIYILMDDEQVDKIKGYGYDTMFESESYEVEELLEIIQTWYSNSCFFGFVASVRTTPYPNEGFTTLIGQGYYWEDEEE